MECATLCIFEPKNEGKYWEIEFQKKSMSLVQVAQASQPFANDCHRF